MPTEEDERYFAAFRVGHKINEYVASVLRERQVWAHCPPLRIRKSLDEIDYYTKKGKDVITRAGSLECKGRTVSFGWEPSSFPFPDQFVDTVESFDSKEEMPVAYVMVSQKTKGIVVLPVSTREQWTKKFVYDKTKKREYEF